MSVRLAKAGKAYRLVEQYHNTPDGVRLSVYACPVEGELVHICTQGSYGNSWIGYHNLECHGDYCTIEQALEAQNYVVY